MSRFTVVLSRTLLASPAAPDGDAGLCAPCLDVVETSDGLVIAVDLPGACPDEIRVTCLGATLVIEGAKAESVRPALVERFHAVERTAGAFRRVVRLPWSVDGDRGEARFRDGVLSVTFRRDGAQTGSPIESEIGG